MIATKICNFLKSISVIILVISFLSPGCATILQSGPDRVPLRSEPDGAKVLLNGIPIGTTPMMLSLDRSESCSIELIKDGYKNTFVNKHKVISGWVFANIIFWPGVFVDLITHNIGKYSTKPIAVILEQIPSTNASNQPAEASAPSSTDHTPKQP